MSETPWELWDFDTNNLIGTYENVTGLVRGAFAMGQANPSMSPGDLDYHNAEAARPSRAAEPLDGLETADEAIERHRDCDFTCGEPTVHALVRYVLSLRKLREVERAATVLTRSGQSVVCSIGEHAKCDGHAPNGPAGATNLCACRCHALAAPHEAVPEPADDVARLGLSDEQTAILRDHLASRQQTVAEFFGDVLMDYGLGRATGREWPLPSMAEAEEPTDEQR